MFLTQFYFFNFIAFSPEFFLILNILFCLLFLSTYNKIYLTYINTKQNTLFVLLLLLLLLYFFPLNFEIIFNGLFCCKLNYTLLKIIITFFLFLFIIMNNNKYLVLTPFLSEYFILLQISLLSLFLILISMNFISLFLSIELQSLTFYILVCLYNENIYSIEASIKYLILGALNTSIFLLGISFIYGSLGSLFFIDILLLSEIFNYLNIFSFLTCIGIFLIIIAFFFKIGIVPFHSWLIDVYEGSPTTIAMFFSIIPKIILISIFITLLNAFKFNFFFFFYIISIISLIIGCFSTLLQQKYKRFLAFSTITHNGFLFIFFFKISIESFQFFYFYNIFYIIMTFLLWSFILIYKNNKYSNLKFITDLNNLYKLNTSYSIIFLILFFSLMGMPPFIGFFTKLGIFWYLYSCNFIFFFFFCCFISCICSYYYLKIIKIIFYDIKQKYISIFILSKEESIILSYLTLSLFFSIFKINLILLFCKKLSLFFFL